MRITKIIVSKKEQEYLQKRNLVKSFLKAQEYILIGRLENVDFKIRQPKSVGVYYFRINKQFRAFCEYRDDILVVFKIDNHQN